MTMPFVPNTTCDVFHNNHVQGVDPPDIVALPIYLMGCWEEGQEAGKLANTDRLYTHKAFFNDSTDIRDNFRGGPLFGTTQDQIYVPNQNGTRYRINLIQRVTRGQASDHFIAYLDRTRVTWPTNNV